MRLRAFGGGERIEGGGVRIAYLDEAGISEGEPYCVVAAVVVDSDRHSKGIETALSDLADGCAPPDKREGFIFHAAELYGGGKTLVRGVSPPDHGRGYLKSLANIPADNDMEVAMHFIEKAEAAALSELPGTARERAILFHTMAYIGCVFALEMLMRERYPDEVMHLVAEDNTQARARLRDAHAFLKDAAKVATLPEETQQGLPLHHIVDTVFFVEKTESSALQLADTCAFVIRRHLERRGDAATYYDPLIPALINRPKTDLDLDVWDARRDAKRAQNALARR